MPTRNYQFMKVDYSGPQKSTREIPVIPVRLRNPESGHEQDVFALVDTGADGCVISDDLAKTFNHRNKAKGVQSHFMVGIEGRQCKSHKHTFDIGLLDAARKRVVWKTGPVLVDCVRSEIPPLLGFECFLKNFRVTIDYRLKMTSLSW
jgi:hypothetical protein